VVFYGKKMDILKNIEADNLNLSNNEIIELLNIKNNSKDYYHLLYISSELSKSKFNEKGYVFAQIGINAGPCSVNCRFCSMGAGHYSLESMWEKDAETLHSEIRRIQKLDINDLFLMTTADYPIGKFLDISENVKLLLKDNQRFVANIGDFDVETARNLKSLGFTGVYHINRLREGIDTKVQPIERGNTIEAAKIAGLEIYYCIEPIGPEHSYDEIAAEIKRARDLRIEVMAVMRRTPVPGTPLYKLGKISAAELTKIVAITNIVVNPARSMNVHEPTQMALLAGVNQLYAEIGANPRDTESNTETSRGFTPDKAWEMLWEGGYYK
jgi:biotin synthase